MTDTLVNSGGPGEYSRGFSDIFAHFWPIFAYFDGNNPSESAGVHLLRQTRLLAKYGISETIDIASIVEL